MRLFAGYVDGQAVAASELAMTWAAVDEGRRLGETTVTLQPPNNAAASMPAWGSTRAGSSRSISERYGQ